MNFNNFSNNNLNDSLFHTCIKKIGLGNLSGDMILKSGDSALFFPILNIYQRNSPITAFEIC